jgi:hypothetical protein
VLGEKSCGAVVYLKKGSETLYLLLHYEAGHWDFVKGGYCILFVLMIS